MPHLFFTPTSACGKGKNYPPISHLSMIMLPLLREENPKYVQHYFGYFILLSFLIPNRHTSLILFYISSS